MQAEALLLLSDASPASAPESGRLTVQGKVFRDEAGQVWQWRGASMFLLFARFLRGEDITPQIQWMQRLGVNVARVFGCVPWGGEWEFFKTPSSPWLPKLDAFFSVLESHGLRCEFVPLTYRHDIPYSLMGMRWYVQSVYDIATHHWGISCEIGNEPAVNRLDVIAILQGLSRQRVPSSYGIYERSDGPFPDWAQIPHLDYVTVHSPRDVHWPRNAKDGMEIRDALRVPVVLDEPWGAGERDSDGGGSRRTQVDDFRSYFGIAHLFSAGCTFHSQAGLEGRAPRADEPIQQAIAEAVRDVWAFLPADVQLGAYSAPHVGNFPVGYQSGDSTQDHAYASLHDREAWLVIPRPRASYVPVGINGWHIVSSLGAELYRLER